jgi:two-component sensor histidine kinase
LEGEEILQKLHLFESSMTHVWLTWDVADTIVVTKCVGEKVITEGSHSLLDLVDKKEIPMLQKFWDGIDSTISNCQFYIRQNGDRWKIDCAAIKKRGSVCCLWVVLPEKDNSIYYLKNAAHDFRSPLGAIMGVVNLMQHSFRSKEGLSEKEVLAYLEMIKMNTDKALSLSDEIMDLAEIESKSFQLQKSKVVMKEFVHRYLETHRLLTLSRKIKVNFESKTEGNTLINESKLTRVLDNVMSNAVKFSKGGSSIDIVLFEEGSMIHLEIQDHGIGMNEKILKNVFVKFGAAKRSGLDGEPSHGLGMSIVQQIMKLHDGKVVVTSTEGVGTKMSLQLKKEL